MSKETNDRPAPPPVERRCAAGKVELRAAAEGSTSPGTIAGYAAVFNSRSEDLGGFFEQIAPGAFADVIERDDVRALVNHDDSLLIGRNRSGTLRMAEDARGLRFEVDLPDNTAGRDAAESIRRGDMSGCSFSFITARDDWDFTGEVPVRTVRAFKRVYDVGPVTYPAYPDTSAAMRSFSAALASLDDARRGLDPSKTTPPPATAPPAAPTLSRAKARLALAEAESF